MCGGDPYTVRYILGAYSEEHNALSAVVIVELVARFYLHPEGVGLISACFGACNGFLYGFAFGLCAVEEGSVALRIFVCRLGAVCRGVEIALFVVEFLIFHFIFALSFDFVSNRGDGTPCSIR